ncbi:SE1832 family protein [Pueribacillus theae]|uniref:SE1832 family protein n=1 Tax=Pueribacillus theae TaxID=2171751 RepID=UPI001F0C4526|nr:SE1832 family protein [Pueribacillus theae]
MSLTKKEIEQRIAELKMEYIRLQNDLEKLESTGQRTSIQENKLGEIEKELRSLREQLDDDF